MVTDVIPSRMFTTPPATASIAQPTASVTSTPTIPLAPEIYLLDDDEIPIGAIIGIIIGAVAILLILVLIVCIVAKR